MALSSVTGLSLVPSTVNDDARRPTNAETSQMRVWYADKVQNPATAS